MSTFVFKICDENYIILQIIKMSHCIADSKIFNIRLCTTIQK